MFTKQHYKAIAKIIDEATKDYPTIKEILIKRFGDYFNQDNALFNWERWRNACRGLPYKK